MARQKPIIGIVIPTLGKRDDYLSDCIASIIAAAAHPIHIQIVAPLETHQKLRTQFGDCVQQFVIDEGKGLPNAINKGILELPSHIEFINWLGDDDLLRPHSLDLCLKSLKSNPDASFVFGGCDYIDENGEVIFTNRSGRWAISLMRFGPQMIPQPGALLRRVIFADIGGLDENFQWAFDLDMFIKLSNKGAALYLKEVLAAFRWHRGSLTVDGREKSVKEASIIRRNNLPKLLQLFSFTWEVPLRALILYAGSRISRKTATG